MIADTDTVTISRYHEVDPSGDIVLVLDLEEDVIHGDGKGQPDDAGPDTPVDPKEEEVTAEGGESQTNDLGSDKALIRL